jgi:hypothetical protein
MKLRNSNRPVRDALLRMVDDAGLHVVERTDRDKLVNLVHRLGAIDAGLDLVRLGPRGDGGYLVPDDLEGMSTAFSPGVADESGFELALAKRGMHVHMADASVDGPAARSDSFSFVRKNIGCVTDDRVMTLEDWKRAVAADEKGDMLLQMDIEGAEYEVLLSTPVTLLKQFRIVVIEFHHLQHLFDRYFFELAAAAFTKLLVNHSVVHIHPNNCCGSVRGQGLEIPRIAEFTLLRDDRVIGRGPRRDFPHPLDADNMTTKPSLPLAECWYGHA